MSGYLLCNSFGVALAFCSSSLQNVRGERSYRTLNHKCLQPDIEPLRSPRDRQGTTEGCQVWSMELEHHFLVLQTHRWGKSSALLMSYKFTFFHQRYLLFLNLPCALHCLEDLEVWGFIYLYLRSWDCSDRAIWCLDTIFSRLLAGLKCSFLRYARWE